MQKFILSTASAALAAVGVLSALAAAPVSAAQIYPVDQARFMTNAKFDFKIELDKKADRKNVVVEINGADYKKVLKGSESGFPKKSIPKAPPSSCVTSKSRSPASTPL